MRFRLIAELGARAFYNGPVGEALLKTSRQLGGTMTAADLREFRIRMGAAHLHRLSRLEGV